MNRRDTESAEKEFFARSMLETLRVLCVSVVILTFFVWGS
jgi:hypothetical protein